MSSFTITESATFTLTHAKYISSKVAADLKRIQRLHNGSPTDSEIADYEAELTEFLKAGYLGEVTYGFQRKIGDTKEWLQPTLIYTASELAGAYWDDADPGKVYPAANVPGAYFASYLTYSAAWDRLSPAEKDAFKGGLPFQRSGMPKPTINGYVVSDHAYSAGGRALSRTSVRSY